jgi:phage/plasmid-associated DNA primase
MQTQNLNALPLSLIKRPSVLDGITLLEQFPIERLKALFKSNLLLMTWEEEYDYETKYANEKEQLSKYMKLYNPSVGGMVVKYGKPKHKWGRAFPYKSLGLSTIRRIVRNTLIDDIYYDFDISNAQPNIIKNLCESNGIPCPIINRYCADRKNLMKEVADRYGVSPNVAKALFIRMCFFGTFYGWCIENKITNQEPMEFITLFERELKDIAERIKKENPTLYETARKKKEDKGENKENKIIGSFFGLYNQEYESRIVEAVICYIINHTDLMKVDGSKTPAGAYEYDGIKLLKKNVDAYEGGLDAVVDMLNEKTLELTGFKLQWTNKEFEEVYDLTELIDEVAEDEKPNEELIADMAKINDAIKRADCGIAETIMQIQPDHYIYSVSKTDGSRGDWYGWNGNRWERSDAPLRKAIMYEVEKHWDTIMTKWNDLYDKMEFEVGEEPDANYKLWKNTKKAMTDRLYQLKTANGIQSIVSVAKTLMANYLLEFDTNPDLFGCENGVIDITGECFRPYRFNDFVTLSCGYDFKPTEMGFKIINADGSERLTDESDFTAEDQASFNYIYNTYQKIFPDEELRNYFFKVISTGMSGRAIEKFFVFNGAGRNGKGVTNEFLQVVLGDYFVSVSPTIYSENQKNKSSAAANPEIAKLDKMRYIVAKEPEKDAPLHNSVVKDMTGGGSTSARMLYSSKTNVKLCGTNVLECNVNPPFSEAPKDADAERINDILFCAKFTNASEEWDETTGETNHIYPLNPSLKEELKANHKNMMLNILLQNLIMVKNANYDVDAFKPESVKKRSLAYLQKSYDVHNIFITLFEKRDEANKDSYRNWKNEPEDQDWSLAKIAQAIRKSNEFFELSKKKQKEYTADAIEEFFCKNNFYKSSIYADSNKHTKKMKEWRRKIETEDNDE